MTLTSNSSTLSTANPIFGLKFENLPPMVYPATPTLDTLPPLLLRPSGSSPRYAYSSVNPAPSLALCRSAATSMASSLFMSTVTPPTLLLASTARKWPPPLMAKVQELRVRMERTWATSEVLDGSTRQAGVT